LKVLTTNELEAVFNLGFVKPVKIMRIVSSAVDPVTFS